MTEITLDCREFLTRDDLHRLFAQALSFPEHYGNNLDALHDCLTSLSTQTQIRLAHWQEAEANLGFYALSAKRVLLEASVESPLVSVYFE